MAEIVVSLKNINKQYWLSLAKQSLIGSFLSIFKAKNGLELKKKVGALKDIELYIKKGEAVGIIGENGSGKTTLLRIISRITVPNDGELFVKGKVAGLLDLGSGFHSELTGKENIYLDAALYGMNRQEINAVYEKIVEFSGLGDFINAQVKTYSQGMLVRLGFAIAIHIDPDIFLIDDSLAVGDEEFQRKCLNKVLELKEQGKTIIVVSHDLDSISRICERGILLKSGRIVKDDSMHKVIMRYVEAVGDKNSIASIDKGRISVIFNSGKIILLWDGKPVTKNFGGYVSLQIIDKWIMSWQAKWQVINNSENSWETEGILARYQVRFIFKCTLNGESLLKFNARIESFGSSELKKTAFGFMISEKYGRFLKEDRIENIDVVQNSGGVWTDIYRTDEVNASLALICQESLPVVKMNFMQNVFPSFSLLQNAGRDIDARIMLMQTSIPDNKKSVSHSEPLIIDYSLRLELLEAKAWNDFIQERRLSGCIELDGLKLQIKQKCIRLFYKNTQLTKNKGLCFGFFYNQRFFDLFEGTWQIKRETSEKLEVFSEFKELNFSLLVVLQLEQKQLKWQVLLQGDDVFAEKGSLSVQANFTEQYDSYFDVAQERGFCAASEHAEKISFKNGEFMGLSAAENAIPHIAFESDMNSLLELQNASFDRTSRMIANSCLNKNSLSGRIVLFEKGEQKSKFLAEKQKEYGFNSICSEAGLRMEFEENKIYLYKDDLLITRGEGFNSGIFFNGRWNESKQLAKKFAKEGQTLKVIIPRRLPEVNEIWTIFFEDERLCWRVELELADSVADLVCKAGISLRDEFTQWTHSFNAGNFSDNEQGQTVELNDKNNVLLGAKAADVNIPALFFQAKHVLYPAGVIINNVDGECSLAFKFKSGKKINNEARQEVFCGEIELSCSDSWGKSIVQYQEQNLSLMMDNRSQLLVTPQKAELLSNGCRLTKKDGLRVSLLTEHGDLDSNQGNWDFRKIDSDKIEIKLTWDNSPIEQRWSFVLNGEIIDWTVLLIAKQRILLKEIYINLFADLKFNRLRTEEAEGEINFTEYRSRTIPIFDNRSDFICLFHNEISALNPAILFRPLVDMNKWFLHTFKYEQEDVIVCGVHGVIDPKGYYLAVGEHEIFKGQISLPDHQGSIPVIKPDHATKAVPQIQSGKLALEICKAKIKLFWQGQELTAALGLHTAFFKQNTWIDSTLAAWKTDISSNKAVVSLYWSKLFALQRWQLHFVNEQEILWQIHTEIQEEGINAFSARLMLKPEYNYYQTDEIDSRKFPDYFNKNCWEELISSNKSVNAIAKDSALPHIFLEGHISGNSFSNIVENSDILHSARVIKCETIEFKHNSKKQYSFSSEIRIVLKGADSGRE
ncbi:MAG: ABC transporter ATP-binding protein [Candidatus Omnitrophota bacterium]